MPFCWCSDSAVENPIKILVVSATDRAGGTSVIEQIGAEYDPSCGTSEARHSSGAVLPPLPTVRDFEEYVFEVPLPSLQASSAAESVPSDGSPPQSIGIGSRSKRQPLDRKVLRVIMTDVGRRMRSEIANAFMRPDASSDVQSVVSRATSASASTRATDRFGTSSFASASSWQPEGQEQAKTSLLKLLKKCDAVLFVVDSADVELCGNRSDCSSAAVCREQESKPSAHCATLSSWQVKVFWGIRRCLAEMVEGKGASLVMDTMNGSSASDSSLLPPWRRERRRVRRSEYPLMLVIANKQDIPRALTPREVAECLGLAPHNISGLQRDKHHATMDWFCCPCVGTSCAYRCCHVIDAVLAHRNRSRSRSRKAASQPSVLPPKADVVYTSEAVDKCTQAPHSRMLAKPPSAEPPCIVVPDHLLEPDTIGLTKNLFSPSADYE